MASLLERLNVAPTSTSGPVRTKSNNSNRASPYNRANRVPKGDPDSPWAHDLFESHNSLSARISTKPTPPRANLNPLAQKALKEATSSSRSDPQQLSIKGASAVSQGNVVEVSGLMSGTTAEDVAAIFKRCGTIVNAKVVPGTAKDDVRIQVTFKASSAASSAVEKFHNQPADGKILSVKIVGKTFAGVTLGGRLGVDGLGLVKEEGSVDVLMEGEDSRRSKLRSDSLLNADPRAKVLLAPPGTDPSEYSQLPTGPRNHNSNGGGRRGGGRGRGGRRGRRGGGEGRMDVD
ncbi:hypothetical protein AMATHDRAFT_57424 [Amanita thiersii Skay4041]|uniref:RRM domain-containing protein n=1 Tax=Amanita thiersii Skay4041 TaxID=703135 RepID=A0A2A9NWG4_9AGAR|nr:hypothetical protein AMATHDRAFT_57424 [Amanita thiersii Skay4041]